MAVSVIGGRDISEDRRRLSKCTAIVATLGRLLHLINNCVISIKQIKLVVLDEADQLITGDFRSSIDKLFRMFARKPQVIASSATYADGLDKLLLKYMHNPAAVSATHEIPMLIGIKQFVHIVTGNSIDDAKIPTIKTMMDKVDAIDHILKNVSFKQCILFSNSQMRAESFFSYLTAKGWKVDLIIGSHEQYRRTSTFQKFCKYESRILIASDVVARGIDVENVNLVVNLDVPTNSSSYLHRIGRCGRFGTCGIAITLLNDDADLKRFQEMLGYIGANGIKISLLPSLSKLNNIQLWNFSNEQSDVSIFNDVDTVSVEAKCPSGIEATIDVNEVNKGKASVQSQNIELLDICKLMLENKSHSSVQVDLDLFADYSNQDVRPDETADSPNDIKEINYSAQGATSNELILMTNRDADATNEKLSDTDAANKEGALAPDTLPNDVFLQAVKNLQIGQSYDVFSPIMADSNSFEESFTEGRPNFSTYVAAVTRKDSTKKHNLCRKSKLKAQYHWQSIYWQQYNQINQYFCWTKSSSASK